MKTVDVAGIRFACVTRTELCRHVDRELRRGSGGWILTANVDIARRLRNPHYKDVTRSVTTIVADGMPIVWASRLQGVGLPARVAGSDLVIDLVALAATSELPLMLIGGNPGIAERAARMFHDEWSESLAIQVEPAPLGFDEHPERLSALLDRVELADPRIVLVALPSPKADVLIASLQDRLRSAWFVGVGSGLSFVTGDQPRAPRHVQRAGLEWLFRLSHEPGRLWRRYLVDDIPFALWLLASAAVRRFRRQSSIAIPLPAVDTRVDAYTRSDAAEAMVGSDR